MTTESDERRRLSDLYGAMGDEVLVALASDILDLSAVAQEVLAAECSRRKLEVPLQPEESEEHEYLPLITLRMFRDLPEAQRCGWDSRFRSPVNSRSARHVARSGWTNQNN